MTAKKLKTVNVAKNDYKVFLGKAKDFYEVDCPVKPGNDNKGYSPVD